MTSNLEAIFASFWRNFACGYPAPVTEYRFDAERHWRFDFAWPARKVAVEIEGATWTRGRHTRGAGFEKDAEKYNAATLLGWRVLRFTGDMLKRTPDACVRQVVELLEDTHADT